MNDFVKQSLQIAQNIQQNVDEHFKPPAQGEKARTNQVIDAVLVKDTEIYLEKVVNQINGAYEHGWYDACAVLLRRLIETLIIEMYEAHQIDHKIKDSQGNFITLKHLIVQATQEKKWNLGRKGKHLEALKALGDLSAHNRRFIAVRSDIEKLIPNIRIVVQELVTLANLKKT